MDRAGGDRLERFPDRSRALHVAEVCDVTHLGELEAAPERLEDLNVPGHALRGQLDLDQLNPRGSQRHAVRLMPAHVRGLVIALPPVPSGRVPGRCGGDGDLVTGRLPIQVRLPLTGPGVGRPHQ